MSEKSVGLGANRSLSAGRPIINALLVGAALLWGVSLLVRGGRLSWPPYSLLNSLSTLAGCLALVGPLILIRSGGLSGSLGELVWLTAGLLVWIFDIEGILRGQWRSLQWATPLHERAMGLTMLAVLLAGWKCGMASWKWSWTSLTGWLLSTFWIGMAIFSWLQSLSGRGPFGLR
jgi:hypothetical protein